LNADNILFYLRSSSNADVDLLVMFQIFQLRQYMKKKKSFS